MLTLCNVILSLWHNRRLVYLSYLYMFQMLIFSTFQPCPTIVVAVSISCKIYFPVPVQFRSCKSQARWILKNYHEGGGNTSAHCISQSASVFVVVVVVPVSRPYAMSELWGGGVPASNSGQFSALDSGCPARIL